MGKILTSFEESSLLSRPRLATLKSAVAIDEDGEEYSVAEACQLLEGTEPSSSAFHKGVWYTHYEFTHDYRTGATANHSYHLKGYSEEEERAVYEAVSR